MFEPPFDDVAFLSPPFWESLQPIADPFLPIIRTSLQRHSAAVLWTKWRADAEAGRGGHWLVRGNAEATRRGEPTFRRSDWERLLMWVFAHPQLGWQGAVAGLLWLAVLGAPPAKTSRSSVPGLP